MAFYSSDHPYDASFAGGTITIHGTTLTAFMDDAQPFTVDEVVSMVLKNDVNGDVYIDQRPALAKIKVAVIAGSDDEKKLRMLYEDTLNVGDDQAWTAITVRSPHGNTYEFSKAYCIASTPCFSVSNIGKISGMMYVFQSMLNRVDMAK